MIKNIAIGSLRNKLVFILPAILVLSQFVPWILTPLLMVGGLYLSFEGAEKLWEEGVRPHPRPPGRRHPRHLEGRGSREADDGRGHPHRLHPVGRDRGDRPQRGGRRGAAVSRAIILIVVAIGITLGVYGVVALIEDGRHRPAPGGVRPRCRQVLQWC